MQVRYSAEILRSLLWYRTQFAHASLTHALQPPHATFTGLLSDMPSALNLPSEENLPPRLTSLAT
ncbi:hypothetical protein LB506_004025 [Fusarium annulatum]|nr:hypothetical protein LB506_004025 [Fusarium annulatum]